MFGGLNYTKYLNKVMSSYALVCLACDITLMTTALVVEHMHFHEGETVTYQCKICRTIIRTKEDIKKHYDSNVHKKYMCVVCKKEFSCKWNLKRHMAIAHTHKVMSDTVPMPYCCTVCLDTFAEKEQLFHHQKNHKKKALVRIICTETLSCSSTSILESPKLDTVSPNLDTMSPNLATISKCASMEPEKKRYRKRQGFRMVEVFRCEQCDQPYIDENALQEHVVNTHTTSPVGLNAMEAFENLADSCSRETVSVEDNSAEPSALRNQIADIVSSDALITASKCNTNYRLINYSQRHKKDAHSYRNYFSCKDCAHTFALKSRFIDHLVDRKVRCCPICYKSFPKFTSICMFNVHVGSHENKIKILSNAHDADSKHISEEISTTFEEISTTIEKPQCKECNEDFLTEENFIEHTALHNSSKTINCSMCNATVSIKHLDRYRWNKYDEIGLITCTSCSKANDGQHDPAHQQGNPNTSNARNDFTLCRLCFNGFSSLYTLREHYRLQHDSACKSSSHEDPIVKCKLCWAPWVYLKLSQLRYHIGLHLGDPSALRAIDNAPQSSTQSTREPTMDPTTKEKPTKKPTKEKPEYEINSKNRAYYTSV